VSVKIIAELNPVSTKRTTFNTESGAVKDIVASLNTGFPPAQARVSRNGEIVKDFSITAEDGDTLWIKFVPYGGSPQQTGAGMKAGGWGLMILGAASAFLLPGAGLFIGAALIGTGLSMAIGGAVLMNINIPSLKDREKPEIDPSIRGSKNQARPHGRIPVLFGRHRIYPDTAANPHTQIIDGRQYFTQLFCGGYKDCVIDLNSFKLGETPVVELSQTKNITSILAGADPFIRIEIMQNGERSGVYPNCVHEDAVMAPLKNRTDEGLPGEIIRTTPDNTDAVNVDIFLPNGIGRYDNNGDLAAASVFIFAFIKKDGEPDSSYQPLGYFTPNHVISGAELKTKRYQITRNGLAPGRYAVKIERLTPDSTDSKVIDIVYLGSVRSVKSARPIRAEMQNELAVIALRVMAAGSLNGLLDRFNYIATSKLPVYAGSGSGRLFWLNAAETKNPASMLLYALRGRPAQQLVGHEDIDWPSLEAFYAWCEQHNYACSAYLSEAVTIADILRMIGNTSRADILRIDSKISVVQDIERPSPVQLFTPKNTISYGAAMFSADIPCAISMRYIDEHAGFAQNELAVYHTPDGNRASEPDSIQKLDLWGVTNSVQARRIGMYNYACLKNRPFVHTIEADVEYLLCAKGDWIQYAGDIALTGSVQGRIAETLWNEETGLLTGIRLDEPAQTEQGRQYAVRLRLSDGTVLLKDVAVIHESFNVFFTEPFEADNAPRKGDLYAFGLRGREILDLIITDIQPSRDLRAALTCVEYSPEIFGVDRPDFILPEFENRITPVSGAVDSGAVNPNRWRAFVIYHDSDHEPPRPVRDGQNDGWHYEQTMRSVWQAAKTAESVDQGEWGQPVRIRNKRDYSDVVPVWLTLSRNNIFLECDGGGNIIAGLLPFTVQADLFKWNVRIPVQNGIAYFPGAGGNLFDPMLDGFYSYENDGLEFLLLDAPEGVSINKNGLITVNAGALLDDENSIAVRAVYGGEAYSAVLFIRKDTSTAPARYLGTVTALPSTANAFIVTGPVQGQVRARQGDYVLAVADGPNWRAGRVYQWTGIAWEFRPPESHADLYIRCFKDGLDVPELTQDMGWFGAVFARLLVVQQAFIEELQAQHITLKNGGLIQSENYRPGILGFKIEHNGNAEFNNIRARGHIEATSGTFHGRIEAGEGYFRGRIEANSGYFHGHIEASELRVTTINISAPVIAGTNHIIKRNNTPFTCTGATLQSVKELVTPAQGTATLRMGFFVPMGVGNQNYYRIRVNGSIVRDWTSPSPLGSENIYSININLNLNINTIELDLRNDIHTGIIRNTVFELLCRDNPGSLRFF